MWQQLRFAGQNKSTWIWINGLDAHLSIYCYDPMLLQINVKKTKFVTTVIGDI